MSSPMALRRAGSGSFRYRPEIFNNKSSSPSMTEDEDELEKPMNNRLSTMNNKRENGSTMIQELLQSNIDLKNEIRDIRRQMKHSHRSDKQRIDTMNTSKMMHDDQNYSDSTELPQYEIEEKGYKQQQLHVCEETITHLRKTIHKMEKQLEQLRNIEQRQTQTDSHQREVYSTDHRFIHELFHLCLKYPSHSSKSKTTIPSHHDMKIYIQQTFHHLIKTLSSKLSDNERNHFICKCPNRINIDHRPSYQYSLDIIEQYQTLFSIKCFTQIPTSLADLYYKHGELNNFIRSISSTLGLNCENQKVLIKTLQKTIDDAKSDELITFKKLTKIKDMNEAIQKIRSYDDFVPYYHKFLDQLAKLLEVSKGDQIIPAIKTLKLLAHYDPEQQPKSLRIVPSNYDNEQSIEENI